MKKSALSLLTFALLLGAHFATAQNFSIGPRLGVNFATLVNDDIDFESNTGLVFGITSTYSINESSGIGIDLLYSTEGAQGDNDTDLNLGYVRIPVMYQYFFRGLGDNLRPKVTAGIVPGFLTKAEISDNDVKDDYNSFDLGISAGLGFHYQLATQTWLNTDFRYVRGLTSVIDNAETDIFNQNFQLSLGVAFGLQ